MRRMTLAVLIVLLACAAPARAQLAPKIGLIGGATLTKLNITDTAGPPTDIYHGQVTPGLGASLTSQVFDRLGVRVEFEWLQKGQTINGSVFGVPASLDLSYFEIPLLGVFDLKGGSIRPYVTGGPSIGLLLGAYQHYQGDTQDTQFSQDIKQFFNSVDFSGVGGVGVAWVNARSRVFIESRYTHGTSNIEINPTRTMKTRGLQFMIGVTAR